MLWSLEMFPRLGHFGQLLPVDMNNEMPKMPGPFVSMASFGAPEALPKMNNAVLTSGEDPKNQACYFLCQIPWFLRGWSQMYMRKL
jgi:hypothetical protein